MNLETTNSPQKKKDIGTLSNPLSGDTKQGGLNAQDDIKLQFERSASLPADNHSVDTCIYYQDRNRTIKLVQANPELKYANEESIMKFCDGCNGYDKRCPFYRR